MNIFATVLTYPAPSANYRGESEENRTVIQKITQGRFEYPIISPEAMRNALREVLAGYGLPCNRQRVHGVAGDEKDELRVRFSDWPDPTKFADDFFFGYLLALKEKGKKNPRAELRKKKGAEHPTKRDSIVRMNLAKALEPYRHDAIFTQSPLNTPDSPWQNAEKSALLHRETSLTAFQYPFAINLNDCKLDDQTLCKAEAKAGEKAKHATLGGQYNDWLRHLLKAISELNGVAGNHARSYFEMAPASIVIRLSHSLVAGYNTYGFDRDGNFPEVVNGILKGDYPAAEFHIGGLLVREVIPGEVRKELKAKGATLHRMANAALNAVAKLPNLCGSGFLPESESPDKEEPDAPPAN